MNGWNFVAGKVENWRCSVYLEILRFTQDTARTKTERQKQIPPLRCGMTTKNR
jgi:hypothetical protein